MQQIPIDHSNVKMCVNRVNMRQMYTLRYKDNLITASSIVKTAIVQRENEVKLVNIQSGNPQEHYILIKVHIVKILHDSIG